MKIFLSLAITFGANNQEKIKKIYQEIEKQGHEILDSFILNPEQKTDLTAKELVDECVALIKKADCLVAEVSSPSLGVGWEICYMSQVENKPVLCLVEEDKKTSIVVTDNPSSNVKIQSYDNQNLSLILREFFGKVKEST